VLPNGIDVGFYQGTIVIQETDGFTVVQGDGLPWPQFIKIAESLR
jgi:hypothetical protein